ncbi:PaaI family thioesterase [Variovorax sp. Sphag1AA]|uniref:PaaI family thioesterase n=1 Tax=Variovorax sp. Sphag1AA TaxID=2587027 RepID=UPI0016175738|nr:PaaI family thioesterase [Variovorax sp. Sphag1AA]MBB3176660.1 uncharacterized protein (TIGR00369 family) [Variovorax sp. Sphag1AA]
MMADVEAPAMQAAPTGYVLLQAGPGFVREIGGLHVHETLPAVGIRIEGGHLNSIRIAHGGFLATIADTAFGVVLKRALALPTSPATVSLTVDYMCAVREGEWLEAFVEIQKAGRQLTNASCVLKVGDTIVLRATGVFVMPRPEQHTNGDKP